MMKATTDIQALCYGEILWDVLPCGAQPGGAPLNVAYHLNKLGLPTGLISKVGDDEAGRKLCGLLDEWGIGSNLVQTDQRYNTSEVLVTLNSEKEATYDILYPVAWDFIAGNDHIYAQIKTTGYLVYGSLSSRNKTSRETLATLLDHQITKVLDINLREPYVNKHDLEGLLSKADIVKFNEEELKRISSMFGGRYHIEMDMVDFIRDTFQISELLVTKGSAGATAYSEGGTFNARGSKITVADTVGSGDAFLAAFILGKHNKYDEQTAINNAVAMGAFTATLKGGCPDYSPADFENFKSRIINYHQ
ncbi:carbohydrate kinase family protein [Mucilaginibacter aquaedulcis]|uniref:carbohydrate kinase family protein n=1 Tax=Mucilaginibacter aquaedulcis TaxID=1187081 RepID=UPI0025B4FADC|nr:carbohydrate kinase [Mucilaginibacter aquaedulcis]MDN3549178.1 carbohydrate kinase [Mucilaginibacter aquaedulcis]